MHNKKGLYNWKLQITDWYRTYHRRIFSVKHLEEMLEIFRINTMTCHQLKQLQHQLLHPFTHRVHVVWELMTTQQLYLQYQYNISVGKLSDTYKHINSLNSVWEAMTWKVLKITVSERVHMHIGLHNKPISSTWLLLLYDTIGLESWVYSLI